jgi:hypothetical protein
MYQNPLLVILQVKRWRFQKQHDPRLRSPVSEPGSTLSSGQSVLLLFHAMMLLCFSNIDIDTIWKHLFSYCAA